MTREDKRIVANLERWFANNQRPLPWRDRYDPYCVWVSEVMLQQTRMEVVLGYYDRFIARFPDVYALAAASEEEVVALWSGLGYYRRARMLWRGARVVVDRWSGAVPAVAEDLRAIPGIGRYTAGAITSIAFGQREPIVDGNVRRILARVFGLESPLGSRALESAVWEKAALLVSQSRSARDFNQGMMEVGALICRPARPECGRCPIRRDCVGFKSGAPGQFPRKGPRVETRRLSIPLYLVADPRGKLLMRREEGPLMTGMLHLPHGNTLLLPDAFEDAFEVGAEGESVGSFQHTITNRRIRFEVIRLPLITSRVNESAGEYVWLSPDDLGTVAIPSYVKKALHIAGL